MNIMLSAIANGLVGKNPVCRKAFGKVNNNPIREGVLAYSWRLYAA